MIATQSRWKVVASVKFTMIGFLWVSYASLFLLALLTALQLSLTSFEVYNPLFPFRDGS